MSKIAEALTILKSIGVPKAQQNERSALTLLALADIKEGSEWVAARQRMIIIHDIMGFIKEHYNVEYAENTRETIRRQTLHQFEQAGIVVRNLDDPERPTNSPKTNYAISLPALEVIKAYGSQSFGSELEKFIGNHGTLIEAYNQRRRKFELLANIKNIQITFSPGKHNALQKEILEEMQPRFFPNADLLYVGDTADKDCYTDDELISELDFPITQHDKLPDVVFYERERNILFFVEAVTSHGPFSPKRFMELENVLSNIDAVKVFISAFPDLKEFRRHLHDIAWETEVWIAENPEHMIHFNGPKFLTGI